VTAAMVAPVVVRGCQGCGACLLTCPEHAFRPARAASGAATLHVVPELCTGCGECVEICPVDAIEFTAENSR
jgi:NAD-dependent dihydropyrimidine dehydrogenase PreA subunit